MEGEKEQDVQPLDTKEESGTVVTDPVEGDEAASEQEEETGDSADPDGADTTAPARKNRGVGKRINELVREREDAKREREEALAEAEYWRKQAGNKPPPDDAPTLEQFDYDHEKFTRALAKWEVRQELKAAAEDYQKQEQRNREHDAITTFKGRVAEFETEHPDFKEVAVNNPLAVAFPLSLVEFIRDNPDGPALAYHAGKNFDDAKLLIKLGETPNKAEAKKAIAAYWAKVKPAKTPPPVKTKTNAPPPPSRLESSAGVQKDWTKLPWDQLKAERERQEAEKRR
jgi:hypothetical protein